MTEIVLLTTVVEIVIFSGRVIFSVLLLKLLFPPPYVIVYSPGGMLNCPFPLDVNTPFAFVAPVKLYACDGVPPQLLTAVTGQFTATDS